MIMYYRCPSCKAVHKILITQQMINNKEFTLVCCNTGNDILTKIKLEMQVIPDISKVDFAVAEEESKVADQKWLYEETAEVQKRIASLKKNEEYNNEV